MFDMKKYMRKYQKSQHGKKICQKAIRKYMQSEKGKLCYNKSQKKYRQTKNGKEARERYQQSSKGKITKSKINARRIHSLGFKILIKNKFNCDIDWHHIDNEYVIAVPRYIHRGTLGKTHRIDCNYIVEKLYDINIKKEIGKNEK